MGDKLSVAFETNGKGFLGFIVELPGAFVRGPDESSALSKTHVEVQSYLRWLHANDSINIQPQVVQRHSCGLMVQEADSEILLDSDKAFLSYTEWMQLMDLVKHSGKSFNMLFEHAQLKDWVDETRIRQTFYGATKKTIKEIFDHVKRTQYYYLSRTGQRAYEEESDSLLTIRDECLQTLNKLFDKQGNSKVYNMDNEDWTLKKIMRRFVWHDRIHGKAIVRILDKQKHAGLISSYEDPFGFVV